MRIVSPALTYGQEICRSALLEVLIEYRRMILCLVSSNAHPSMPMVPVCNIAPSAQNSVVIVIGRVVSSFLSYVSRRIAQGFLPRSGEIVLANVLGTIQALSSTAEDCKKFRLFTLFSSYSLSRPSPLPRTFRTSPGIAQGSSLLVTPFESNLRPMRIRVCVAQR